MTNNLDDDVQGAAVRVGAYLAERAGMGGKDVIHGYADGDGVVLFELRASDVLVLVNVADQATAPAPVVIPEPRTATTRLAPRTGDDAEDRRCSAAIDLMLKAWPDGLGMRVVEAVVELDAFGALAWKLHQAGMAELDTVALLRTIGVASVEWAISSASNPAAFLASRLQKLQDV